MNLTVQQYSNKYTHLAMDTDLPIQNGLVRG